MVEQTIKLPDIGEGIAESEISEWLVSVGDIVQEDEPLVVVMTDKAAVEIPSSLTGKVLWLAADAGEVLAVGAPLVKIDVFDDEGDSQAPGVEEKTPSDMNDMPPLKAVPSNSPGAVLAAPAVRKRALDLGVELDGIAGSGPDGQITHADLDRVLVGQLPSGARPVSDAVEEIRIIGLRRKIAEKMAQAHASIPSISIIEEVDVTELERLRAGMNAARKASQAKLTLLPFLIRAMVQARDAAPQVNACYDEANGVLHQHGAVHMGIATQTDSGLMVPVIAHADTRSVWDCAAEIARLAEGARDGVLTREELGGSTMTITSLGPLGAIATTPIVNHPEVAIVGVNRKQMRPQWDGHQFVPREMMNLSASFDHRIVDGFDAAQFIARLKTFLETPAMLFVTGEEN